MQHFGANPLSWTHLSPSSFRSFRSFLFFIVSASQDTSFPHFLLRSFLVRFLWFSLAFLHFVFSCLYFGFPPPVHRPDFCSNNVSVSIIMPLYISEFIFSHSFRFFSLAVLLHSLSCLSRHFAPSLLIVLCFLRR